MTTSDQHLNTPLTREDASAPDAMERSRQVSVHARGNRVVLQVPPGEVAVLHPDEARALADRLYEQADSAQPSATVLPFRRKARSNRPRTGSGA